MTCKSHCHWLHLQQKMYISRPRIPVLAAAGNMLENQTLKPDQNLETKNCILTRSPGGPLCNFEKPWSRRVVLKSSQASESPGGTVKPDCWLYPQSFWASVSGKGPTACISQQLPGIHLEKHPQSTSAREARLHSEAENAKIIESTSHHSGAASELGGHLRHQLSGPTPDLVCST